MYKIFVDYLISLPPQERIDFISEIYNGAISFITLSAIAL